MGHMLYSCYLFWKGKRAQKTNKPSKNDRSEHAVTPLGMPRTVISSALASVMEGDKFFPLGASSTFPLCRFV